MTDRKTTIIPLEIYKDKQVEFLAAIHTLMNGNHIDDTELMKVLKESIHLDLNPFDEILDTFSNNVNVEIRLKDTWQYFNSAKNDSPSYQLIFGDTYEQFIDTKFGESLKYCFSAFDAIRLLQGKEDTLKIQVAKALIITGFNSFMKAIGEGISTSMQSSISYGLAVTELNNCKINSRMSVDNKIQFYQEGTEDILECDAYIEFNGELIKVMDSSQIENINESARTAIFFVDNSDVTRVKLTENDEWELTYYNKATITNYKLDLTHNTSTTTILLPKNFFAESVHSFNEETGETVMEYRFPPVDVSQKIPEENPIIEKFDKVKIEPYVDKNNIGSLELMNIMGHFLQKYLFLPQTKSEEMEWADLILFNLWQILHQHHPDISHYSKCTIVGFILGQLNIIESQKKYDSNKRSTYRNYIKDYVAKRLKLSKTIMQLRDEGANFNDNDIDLH